MRSLLVVSCVLLLLGSGDSRRACAAEKARPTGRPASAAQAAAGNKFIAVGTVEPEEVADVGAQLAGQIVSLGADPRAPGKLIDYGSQVEAGTVLARIDPALYEARVEREQAGCKRAQAELDQARIQLERAEARWRRAQDLKKNKAIPQTDFEQAPLNLQTAKAAVVVAEATLAQNKAALKHAQIELDRTILRSPIRGVVLDRRVRPGQWIAPAAASGAFLVAKVDKLQVWASVPETNISRVRPEQSVRFTVDAFPGKVFRGKVAQIRLNAAMTQNVVTYTVVIAVSGPTEPLLPYLTATVEFE